MSQQAKPRSEKRRGSLRPPVGPLVTNLLLLGTSVLFTLGLVEALLRLAPGLMPETARIYARRQNAGELGVRTGTLSHPYVGYLYPGGVEKTIKRGSLTFTYRTDAFGFRNSQPWPRNGEIVALGDSIAFGWGVNDDQTWTALLQRALRKSYVVNLALPGGAPQQYLRIYETYGLSLQPNVVLVGLFPGNDLKDAAEFDAWLMSGAGGNYDLWRSFRVSTPGLQYLFAGLIKRSYLFAFLLHRVRYGTNQLADRSRTISFDDGSRLLLLPRLLESLAEGVNPDSKELRLIIRTLEHLHSVAAAHGTHSVVLLLPMKEEIYLPLIEGKGTHGSDPSAPIRAALSLRGIPYLDLAPHFREQAAAGQRLFFEVGWHPNAAGYALIAEVVLSHLKANATRYGLKDWERDRPSAGP